MRRNHPRPGPSGDRPVWSGFCLRCALKTGVCAWDQSGDPNHQAPCNATPDVTPTPKYRNFDPTAPQYSTWGTNTSPICGNCAPNKDEQVNVLLVPSSSHSASYDVQITPNGEGSGGFVPLPGVTQSVSNRSNFGSVLMAPTLTSLSINGGLIGTVVTNIAASVIRGSAAFFRWVFLPAKRAIF